MKKLLLDNHFTNMTKVKKALKHFSLGNCKSVEEGKEKLLQVSYSELVKFINGYN